ncbi:MAG: hypothetical protein U0573_12785 [Phycisphaerales bacterium]|nr:hypothetical protein [Planctomycetota bacterium]
MSPADPAKSLQSLLKKLQNRYGELQSEPLTAGVDEGVDPLLHLFVYSFLLWDASTGQARAALKRIRDTFVDYNEMRIAFADEIAAAFGERYPRGYERALRLRSSLHDIFRREHALSLHRLQEMSKREAAAYLDSIDGTPAYVAARVLLIGLKGHAIPVDQRIADLLASEAVLGDDVTDAESAAKWLERQIRAGDALPCAMALQAWSDDQGAAPRRDRRADVPDFSPPEIPPPAGPEPEPASGSKKPAKSRKPAKKTGKQSAKG